MSSQDFVQRVQKAIERMKAEGITLWRPRVSEELEQIFDVVIVQESVGCDNEMCNHVSHDPASPYIKLIPKSGKLLFLGDVQYSDVRYYYYALLMSSGTKYFEVKEEPFYWNGIHEISADEVPDYLLSQFSGEGND
jgi:hypothetical protein